MIDMTKQYRTRDGREVKLLMVDGGGHFPVIGAFKRENGVWVATCWSEDGSHSMYGDRKYDLIEVRPRIRREVWVNVYRDFAHPVVHLTREIADKAADSDRIACVRVMIDCEDGEGL